MGVVRHGGWLLHRRTYRVWSNMKARCHNKNAPNYSMYGARGIKVCERWHDFALFLQDMGDKPDGLTLERKDNGGNYEPSNCRWATPQEQSRNTRRNRKLTYKGETLLLADWADKLHIHRATLWSRLSRSKWPIDLALSTKQQSGHFGKVLRKMQEEFK